MENKVLLLDDLGKKYGETHVYYNLKTPAEAIKLLCINYPEFAKDIFDLQKQGIFYKVQQVDIDLELSDLFLPLGSHDLVVTPVISGSGDFGNVLLGIALIGFTGGLGAAGFGGALFGHTGLTGLAAISAQVGSAIGVSLVIGGVSNMLAPQPTLSTMDTEGAFTNFNSGPASLSKGADGMQTFAFTGATNSSGLGKTIPVAYGKVLAGSLVIGAQIEPDGEDDKSKKSFFRAPGLGTFTINGDKPVNKFRDCGGIVAKFKKPPFQKSVKKQGKKGNLRYAKGTTKTLDFSESEQHITTNALVKGDLASIKGQKYTNEGFGTKLFCIAFSIKGLINRIGDENSTKIDGFITFQVIIKEQTSNNVVGKHQMTIQGLMTKSNSHKRLFIVKLPYSHVSGKDRYRVFIKIIDKSIIDDDCTFKVEQLGYALI